MRIFFTSVSVICLFLAFAPAKVFAFSSENMSLDEKIGQLMFVGFQGEDLDQMTASHFQSIRPGAYILFGRNITSSLQVHKLNQQLQKVSRDFTGVPALIALDQEGGSVSRVQTNPPLPSPRAIGKTKNPELAKSFGREIGIVVRSLGFNMNLAPVLDVTPANVWDFIGNRSFGTTTENVSTTGRAFAEGLLSAGVLPTAKHFPGSGGLKLDPHFSSPESLISKEDLLGDIISPFRNYSDLFPSAMMLSHVRYPNIDSSNVPAGFSKIIANDIVRGSLNYRGLVVTDDLLMDGAKLFGKTGNAAVSALAAGADLVMVSWSRKDQVEVFNSIKSAIADGRLSKAAIDAKVKRILQIKKILTSQAFEKNQRVPKIQNSHLASLEMELLLENLEQDLAGKSLRSSPVKSLFVFSKDQKFTEQIRRSLNVPITVFSSLPSLQKALKDHPEALAIVLANNRSISTALDSVGSRFKSQILTISSVSPGPQKSAAFWGQIYTYFMHPRLGWELGVALNAKTNGISFNK